MKLVDLEGKTILNFPNDSLILVHGTTLSGKTVLLNKIAKDLSREKNILYIDNYKSMKYKTLSELSNKPNVQIKQRFFSLTDVLDELETLKREVEVVIIDNFPLSSLTSADRETEKKIKVLINSLRLKKRITFIISDELIVVSKNDLIAKFTKTNDELLCERSPYERKRIFENLNQSFVIKVKNIEKTIELEILNKIVTD